MEDRHVLRTTLLIGLPGIVVVQYLFIVVYPIFSGSEPWHAPDVVMGTIPGMALIHGHLRQVYANRYFYNLPLSLPVSGLLQQATVGLHIRRWQDQYTVIDVAYLMIGLVAVYQMRRLAWTLGLRRRLALLQGAGFVLVAMPVAEWGHGEDVIALVLVLEGIRCLLRRRQLPAALCISAAIASKQWAIMLIPVVVMAAPAGRRLRVLAASIGLPLVLAGFFLVIDFRRAMSAFTAPVTQVKGFPGHPWIDGNWLGAHSSTANRAAAVLLAVALVWFARRWLDDPANLVSLCGLVLLLRPLTETINYSYYWTPGLAVVIVASIAAEPARRWRTWAWALGAELWTLPRSSDVKALIWWAGEALLLAFAASALPVFRRPGPAREAPVPAPAAALTSG